MAIQKKRKGNEESRIFLKSTKSSREPHPPESRTVARIQENQQLRENFSIRGGNKTLIKATPLEEHPVELTDEERKIFRKSTSLGGGGFIRGKVN